MRTPYKSSDTFQITLKLWDHSLIMHISSGVVFVKPKRLWVMQTVHQPHILIDHSGPGSTLEQQQATILMQSDDIANQLDQHAQRLSTLKSSLPQITATQSQSSETPSQEQTTITAGC